MASWVVESIPETRSGDTAHGGLDRWNAVRSVDVTFNFSGSLLDLKGAEPHDQVTVADRQSQALRSVMPLAQPNERAALLSAFYVEGYLAFTLPAMLAGFLAPVVGLTTAAEFYGGAVIFLALASLSATTFWKMNR